LTGRRLPSPTPPEASSTRRSLVPAGLVLAAALAVPAAPAWAVDTVGSLPGPAAGDASDAPTASSPWGATTGDPVITARLEYARRTLWGITRKEDCTGSDCSTTGALLGGVIHTHLGAQQGIGRHLTLGVSTQLQVSAWAVEEGLAQGLDRLGSPRLMDLHAWGRLTLVETPRTAVAVVPWLSLDGGLLSAPDSGHALVGTGSSAAGRLVWGLRSHEVTTASLPVWTVVADGGIRTTLGLDATGPPNTNQRLAVDGMVGGSWAIAPQGAVVGELRLRSVEVDKYFYAGAELRGGVRWRVADDLEAVGLLGLSPTRAPSDAHPRLVAGVRYVPAAPTHDATVSADAVSLRAVDTDGWRLQATARSASGHTHGVGPGLPGETRVELPADQDHVWLQADGTVSREVVDARSRPTMRPVVLPLATGEGVLWTRVVDLDGLPMPRAKVRMNGQDLGFVEPDGSILLDGLETGVQSLELSAPDFETRTVRVPVLPRSEDLQPERIQLRPPLGQVRIHVTGPSGPIPKATVQVLSSVAKARSLVLDDEGSVTDVLLPGRSIVRVEAPGFGAQELVVDIDPARVRTEELRFRLRPADAAGGTLELTVVDTDGRSVEGADVKVGGENIGRTASGGVLRIEGIKTGRTRVEVEAEDFRSYDEVAVDVDGSTAAEVVTPLRWEAGAVRMVVTGSEGPVPDTMVSFSGPGAIEPQRVRGDGFLDMQLPIGEWLVTFEAPGHAAQQRTIKVTSDEDRQLRVDVRLLRQTDAATGSLALRFEDEAGEPLAGVQVTANGALLGTSTGDGDLIVRGVPVGEIELVAEGPTTDVLRELIELDADGTRRQTLRLAPRPGVVTVIARSSGQPLDAFLRLIGPQQLAPLRLGATGEREVALRPGAWELIFTHESHALTVMDLEIEAGLREPLQIVWDAESTEMSAITGLERVPLVVRTLDAADDQPLDSQVRLLGPTVVPVMETGADGELEVRVVPGAWEVLASAAGTAIAGADTEVDAASKPDPVVIRIGDARVSVSDVAVALSETVQFETGSAQLLPLSWGLLDEVARTLRAAPQLVHVAVVGHTDSTGSEEVNRVLSHERAEAVRAYLIARGVEPGRLRAEGYGASVPLESNDTEEGREANRRVAFRIVDQTVARNDAAEQP